MTAYTSGIGNALPSIAAHAIPIGEGLNPINGVALNTGQVLVGVTGADPVAQTLANVTNWVDQTSSSVTMAVNTGYLTDNGATLVTYTLPTTCAFGSVMEIAGNSAGGWSIAQGSGQSIKLGSVTSTTGAGGSVSSSNAGDCIRFLCIVANSTFRALSMQGNLTYV